MPVQAQLHWESIVRTGDTVKFFAATSEPDSGWNGIGFNDSLWQSGPEGIGYGDGDDSTIIPPVNSVYLRIPFFVTDKSIIDDVLLDMDYDDAFVAYLNGTEIARSSNITANPPLFDSPLTIDHEAQLYQGGLPERHIVDTALLRNGLNLLAVQVINVGITSSDLSSNVFLDAELNSGTQIYQTTPTWFVPPVPFDSSNLPLIIINTNGQEINDESKIDVHMGIIDNPSGINKITDTFNNYNGIIGIDIRGSSSEMFEKKSYNIETRTSTDDNNNVPLVGLPEENDWVLYATYTDKSMMRNALTYYLGNETGRWAPHSIFCEMYLNGYYNGVYALTEKIKRDKHRVNITKLTPDITSGIELTGGYIVSIDRPDVGAWTSTYLTPYTSETVYFNKIFPKVDNMPAEQVNYIEHYVLNFEDVLHGDNFLDPDSGYKKIADLNSIVDYYIITEMNRNVDGYRLSTFFYKDADNKGGKLTMGPLWDYDLAFGNANYGDAYMTDGWITDMTDYGAPFWYYRFRQDPEFNSILKQRWNELRSGPFTLDKIDAVVDSFSNLLQDAQARNYLRFPILGTYVWPNYFVGATYASEVDYLKTWIHDRVTWMDGQIATIPSSINNTEIIANSYDVYTYPNPFKEEFNLHLYLFKPADIRFELYDITGQSVYEFNQSLSSGVQVIPVILKNTNSPGAIYFYRVSINGQIIRDGKIAKQ